MIEKAKAAKSAEELLEVAKAGGIEMTADEAATYFAQLNPQSGELDDDALDGVAGGACDIYIGTIEDKANANAAGMACPKCSTVGDWERIGTGLHSEQSYRCRTCGQEMYLSNDDDYAVLHAK
jgi:DNA-directed RNA polymerase subunit RPC12/RpoP